MSDKLTVINHELFKVDSNSSLKALTSIELKYDCTLADVRKHGTPPVSALVRDGDKTECYKLIKMLIVALNQYVGTTWSDYQITEVAKEFYARYFYFTQLDLINFFRKCRNMEFEKILSANQFTPLIFMQWAAQYDRDWTEESINQSLGSHQQNVYDQERAKEVATQELEAGERSQDPVYQKQQKANEKRSKQIAKGNADESFFERNLSTISKALEKWKK